MFRKLWNKLRRKQQPQVVQWTTNWPNVSDGPEVAYNSVNNVYQEYIADLPPPPQWVDVEVGPEMFVPTSCDYVWEDRTTAMWLSNGEYRGKMVINSRGCMKIGQWQRLTETGDG